MITTIVLRNLKHQDKACIAITFPYDVTLKSLISVMDGVKWSQTNRCFYLEYSIANYKKLIDQFDQKQIKYDSRHFIHPSKVTYYSGAGTPTIIKTSEEKLIHAKASKELFGDGKTEIIDSFKKWLCSKRYSENTVKTYINAIKSFLLFYASKPIDEINNQDVIKFNNEYILANKYSSSYQNQVVNAIKLFFKTINNKTIDVELIHRPKRSIILPNVLSKEEVKKILDSTQNIKHKAMLSLIYACGLRCGELLMLKAEHVDSNRNLLIIKNAKGKKDRIVPLSNKIIKLLREYFLAYKPINYLFEGQTKGTKYDARSLQQVLKQNVARAKIRKPITLHWLRHSYATHLLESGTDLRYIQEILGHKSSKTTEIYTHVSTKNIQNIVSPFDTL